MTHAITIPVIVRNSFMAQWAGMQASRIVGDDIAFLNFVTAETAAAQLGLAYTASRKNKITEELSRYIQQAKAVGTVPMDADGNRILPLSLWATFLPGALATSPTKLVTQTNGIAMLPKGE